MCPTGQSTAPQKFALWQVYGATEGNVVPGSVVTSGTLTAGQWNYIPLPTPLQLSIGNVPGIGAAIYEAATGFSGSFPDTNSQFGAGEPYASGIKNGPLFGYSDQAASAPCPASAASFQGAFGVGGTDPSVNMPAQGSSSSNFWIDLQVSDTAPVGYSGSYRLWPNFPTVFPTQATIDTQAQTVGTQFSLSEPCTVNNVWFYSPPFAQDLPASTQIWNATTQTLVSGTNLTASWSGGVASGWVANSYGSAGIVLPAGNYIATMYYGGGKVFYMESRGYFGSFLGQCRACHQRHGQRAAVVTFQRERVQPPGREQLLLRGRHQPRPIPMHGTPMTAGRTAGWTSRSPRQRRRRPRRLRLRQPRRRPRPWSLIPALSSCSSRKSREVECSDGSLSCPPAKGP